MFIKTERFVLNTNNGSGALIVFDNDDFIKKKRAVAKNKPCGTDIITTESFEYYKEQRQRRYEKEERYRKECYQTENLDQKHSEASLICPKKIKKRYLIPSQHGLIQKNDKYIYFQY